MGLLRSPSFWTLSAVLAAGAVVGLPRAQAWHERTLDQEGRIVALRGELRSLKQRHATLVRRHATLSEALAAARTDLEDQAHLLASQSDLVARGLSRVDGLRDTVAAQAAAVARMDERGQRAALQRAILEPVFQIAGEEAVGSAVLVRRVADGDDPHYLALSCYHVLRDIVRAHPDSAPHEVPIQTRFDRPGDDGPLELTARMIAQNPAADLALLRIATGEDLGPVARIAPLARQGEITPFTPVYTVGCPLGTTPQATRGEVTRLDWSVDGQPYWMVSSPAYFGNSGGGVFLEESRELIGVFSKIYTHGNYRPQVVTHMGLSVPLDEVHAWLREIGRADLLPAPADDVNTEEAGVSGTAAPAR